MIEIIGWDKKCVETHFNWPISTECNPFLTGFPIAAGHFNARPQDKFELPRFNAVLPLLESGYFGAMPSSCVARQASHTRCKAVKLVITARIQRVMLN